MYVTPLVACVNPCAKAAAGYFPSPQLQRRMVMPLAVPRTFGFARFTDLVFRDLQVLRKNGVVESFLGVFGLWVGTLVLDVSAHKEVPFQFTFASWA